jgi:hypothetical protein
MLLVVKIDISASAGRKKMRSRAFLRFAAESIDLPWSLPPAPIRHRDGKHVGRSG